MLSLLSIVAVTLLVALLVKLLFFNSRGDGGIKVTAPFWLFPYRTIIQKKSAADVAKEIVRKYGPICYVWFGPDKRVVISDPELARQVYTQLDNFPKHLLFGTQSKLAKFFGLQVALVSGDMWKKQRRVMNPAFKIQIIKSFTDIFIDKIQIFMDIVEKRFQEAEAKNEEFVFEPNDLLQKMTLDVLGKTVFDHDFDTMRRKDEFVDAYNYIIRTVFTPKFLFAPWIFETGFFKETENEMAKFDRFIYDIIEERRQKLAKDPAAEPKDLLGMLLKSVDEDILTDVELRDNVFLFFLAGHETTSGSLASALFCLSKYQQEQNKLLEDVKSLGGALPTYERIQHFEQIPNFIREVMRMHSPSILLPSREPQKDVQLGPYTIFKKTRVVINIDGIQHSPSLWKEPLRFDTSRYRKSPDEFENDDSSTSWMAFGWGARACMGNNFSLLEQKLFLSMLLQRYVIEPYPTYEYKQPVIGLMFPRELKVILKRRPQLIA